MNGRTHYRDRGLGEALRELEVPEHREAFFAELEAQLAEQGGKTFRLLRPFTRRTGIVALAGAAAAFVLGLALAQVRDGSGVAEAAAVRSQVMRTLSGTQSVRGRLVYRALDARAGKVVTARYSFAADGRGDFRLTNANGTEDLAYDAAAGVERAITTSASIGSGRFYAERTGLAPGAPDEGPSEFLLDRELGALVRALAASREPRVQDVTYHGHPAWRLDVRVEPNSLEPDIDRITVTVDKRSGFPVHVVSSLRGRFRSELTLTELVVDKPLGVGEFTVRFPANPEILRTDAGFTHDGLQHAAAVVGYRPLVPRTIPAGFRLAIVAVARKTSTTGPGGSNPPSRNVVSLAYRRGLDQFTVTTRLRTEGLWRDPFAVEGLALPGEHVRLAGGAFGGARAAVVLDPRTIPHIWAVTDRLVLTISGDLTRAQLLAVADGVR